MKATNNPVYSVTQDIHTSTRNERQAAHSEQALSALAVSSRRHRFKQNQRWAELDRQAVDMLARRDQARREGNERAAGLAQRALGSIVKQMKNLLDSEAA